MTATTSSQLRPSRSQPSSKRGHGPHGLRGHPGRIDAVELGNLTGLLAKTRPAAAATSCAGERSAMNPGFVDVGAQTNVRMTIHAIRAGSAVLAAMEATGSIKIVGAM